MDTLLIVITCISIVSAGAMAGMLLVVVRRERRRSEARIMALMDIAAAETLDSDAGVVPPIEDRVRFSHDNASHPASVDALHPRLEDDEGRESVHGRSLFIHREAESPWLPRAAVATGIALLLLVAIAAASWSRGAEAPEVPAAATTSAAPLDLLSLRHEAESDDVTISGVVQNPHGSAPLRDVTAVAFLLADDGRLLGSGRAPIDFPLLRAGDESPFVVRVAVGGAVSRYRIGFRAADGRVLAHVDRRAPGALARTGDQNSR